MRAWMRAELPTTLPRVRKEKRTMMASSNRCCAIQISLRGRCIGLRPTLRAAKRQDSVASAVLCSSAIRSTLMRWVMTIVNPSTTVTWTTRCSRSSESRKNSTGAGVTNTVGRIRSAGQRPKHSRDSATRTRTFRGSTGARAVTTSTASDAGGPRRRCSRWEAILMSDRCPRLRL